MTVLPRLKPSVAVLDSVVATGPYVDSLIPEMTQQLRDDLRRRGYDVLVSSLGSRSVEQFVVQFRGLSSEQQHLIGKPDFVAQLTLRVSEERRNLPAPNIVNPFGRFRNGPPQPALAQLTSTCVASINVIRVPEGQYFDRGTSGDIQLSGVVNTQLAGWQAAQKSLTTHTAQKAVAEALSRLQQRQ